MLANTLRKMTRPPTLQRTRLVAQHLMTSTAASTQSHQAAEVTEPPVLFESNGSVRRYILNRPKKANALDQSMIDALRPKLQEWETSDLCRIVVGDGAGRSFCAGGDVKAVSLHGRNRKTRPKAIEYFKHEFELDYQLATLRKPYVVICDGHTMGGGVGLSAHAPFKIATENTQFAMPETKIGYCPDVGANFFLPRMDGEIGTYLALTGNTLVGRAVFENGFATHYVPSRRITQLLAQLAALEEPTLEKINTTIEEHYGEPEPGESSNAIVGDIRIAVDAVFAHNSVEKIFASLKKIEVSDSGPVGVWAKQTLSELELRSPTSLKVALKAIRKGKTLSLADALCMEMGIATAFLNGASPDFHTGVEAVVIDKSKRGKRPKWSPGQVEEVSDDLVERFFKGEFLETAPALELPDEGLITPSKFALPSESEVEKIVRGTHAQSSNVAYSLDDLVSKFHSMNGFKHGTEDKIQEIVSRRCEVSKDADGPQWLRWK